MPHHKIAHQNQGSGGLTRRLLDVLLPEGGYVLQLAEAYFDESESDGVLCVAGYLFEKEASIALDKKWKQVLDDHGLIFFHMVDCAHLNGEFKGRSRAESIEVETKLINILKEHLSYGYACAMELKFAHLLPSAKAHGFHVMSPYMICCYFCLMGARSWADSKNYRGQIAYFFESGHASHGEANKMMNAIFAESELKEFYRYSSHTFADKKLVRPLQCADILAWQWRKNVKERMKGNTKTRADLFSLVEKQHYVHHFDEKTLIEFRQVISQANAQIAFKKYKRKWGWLS